MERKYPITKCRKIREFYDYYIETLDDIERKNGYVVDYKMWRRCVSAVGLLGIKRVIENGERLLIPAIGLNIGVVQRPALCWVFSNKKKEWVFYGVPDWGKTNKLWAADEQAKRDKKLIYFIPEGDTVYSIRVWPVMATTSVGSLYKFTISNKNKDLLCRHLKNNKVDYEEHIPRFVKRYKPE